MENKKNKIISIIGNYKVGKTTLMFLILKLFKNKKILIINFNFKIKEIQKYFNSYINIKNPIIKINKNLFYLNKFKINKNNFNYEINKLKNKYEIILIESNLDSYYLNKILNISNKKILLIEPTINHIKKINKIKNKINNYEIIINKKKLNSINKKIIENILNKKIIYKINYKKNILNKNLNNKIKKLIIYNKKNK